MLPTIWDQILCAEEASGCILSGTERPKKANFGLPETIRVTKNKRRRFSLAFAKFSHTNMLCR